MMFKYIVCLLSLISSTCGGSLAFGGLDGTLSVMDRSVCESIGFGSLRHAWNGHATSVITSFGEGKLVVDGGIRVVVESQDDSTLGGGVVNRVIIFPETDLRIGRVLSTFLFFDIQNSIIATWGNKQLTRCVLTWSTLTMMLLVLSYSGFSYVLQLFIDLHNGYLRHLRFGFFSGLSFVFRYGFWLFVTLGDDMIKLMIRIFNIYNIRKAAFLWSYYCLMTGGLLYCYPITSLFIAWLVVSLACNFVGFEDFFQFENRFLTSDESKDAKIKQSVLYGAMSQLDYLLPYTITSQYRNGYVYFVIKTQWKANGKERKSYCLRYVYNRIPDLPGSDPEPLGPDPDSGPEIVPGPKLSKTAAFRADLKRFIGYYEPKIQDFARSWVYTQYSLATYQALCDGVVVTAPKRFYVGQGLYNAITDQKGEHVDQLEDIVGLVAGLIIASYHVNSTAKTLAITQALEQFRKSTLGTKICNGIANTKFTIDDVFLHSELGTQISEFVEHMTHTVEQGVRVTKKFGGLSCEKVAGLSACAFKMITHLTASQSMSTFRQRINERVQLSADKFAASCPSKEEAARTKRATDIDSINSAPTWCELPPVATYQAGLVDSFEAIRSALSMGKEGAQFISSGKVLKLITSFMALGTLMRSGRFEPRAYDELVSSIKSHPGMQATCLFEGICESCNWLLSAGHDIYHGGSLFGIPSSIRKWEKDSMELLLHQKFVGNDLLLDEKGQRMDSMVLRIKLVDAIAQYNRISVQLSTLTSSRDSLKLYKSLYDQLRCFLAELRIREDTGSTRIPPFGILLHGLPGIGKTTLMNGIFTWLSLRDGMPFDKNAVFRRPPGSKFWSNFNSEKLWLILDDVATFRASSKKVDESLTDIIHVLNSSPFNPDMNQNDEKGKFSCNIRAVCATTNRLDMDAHIDFNSPAAVFRRFQFYITVKLKQGPFNVNGHLKAGNMTDAEYEALGSGSCRLFPNFWTFDMHTYTAGQLPVTRTFNSFYELMECMSADYVKHRATEGLVKDREEEYAKVTLCPTSLVPTCLCSCDNCPRGIATRKAEKEKMATRIENMRRSILARRVVAKLQADRAAAALALASVVQSGTCFSFAKAKPIIPTVYFYWYQLFLLCLICIVGYVIYRFVRSIWRGIQADMIHVVSERLSVQLDTSVKETVVEYYPQVCAEFTRYFQEEMLATRIWFQQRCQAVLEQWTFQGVLSSLAYSAYFSSLYCIAGSMNLYARARRSLFLFNLYREIKARMTYRNLLILALVAAISGCLFASKRLGMFVPSVKAVPQMGRPEPCPGPGGSEAPRNVWFEDSALADTFGIATRCARGTAMDPAVTSLMNNIVIVVFESSKGTSACHGYLVGGQYMLLNNHSLNGVFDIPTVMNIAFPFGSSGGKLMRIPINKKRIVRNKTNDIALMHVAELPVRNDKYDFFIEENHDWSLFKDYSFCLPTTEVEGHTTLANVMPAASWMEPGGRSVQARVTVPTKSGDCGRIVLACGPHGACILGIHQSMSLKDSLDVQAALVTRTWLLRAKDALRAACEVETEITVAQYQNCVTFAPVHFGDLNQASDVILDANDEPVKMKAMSELCALHPKHKSDDENFSITGFNIFWIGKISDIGRKKMVSNVRVTPFRSMFEKFGYVCTKEAPKFDWKAKVLHARNLGRTSNNIDADILEECVQVYIKQILQSLPKEEHNLFEVYDLETALNGADGVAYVDSVKVKTSAGFPYYKPKRELLYTDFDGRTVTYTMQPQFEKNLWRYYHMMIAGERPRLLFSANMKDEGISPEKNKIRGPRLFMAGNIYSILLGRMLFLSYIRVVQRNPFIFFSAPGMNTYSRIWSKLFTFITRFGFDTLIAGDYKNFDQKMAPKILEAAYSVIIGVMTSKIDGKSKFSDEERLAAKVWASSCAFPDCEIDGDCYQVCGTNPSGNTMTVHTNCTVNVLYIMYAWRWTGHRLEIFFIMVVIMTYGDDNIVGVCVTFKVTFNYGTIYPALLSIGVEYTPADKSLPTSKCFDAIESLQFLKRGFREENGRLLCPIDVATIHKLGMLWVKSNLSDEAHGLAILRDIWRESYLHGGEFKKLNQGYVVEVLKQHYNQDITIGGFLTDMEYEKQFDENSIRYEAFSTKKSECVNICSNTAPPTYVAQLLIQGVHSAEERGCHVDPPEAIPQTTNLVKVGVLQDESIDELWSELFDIKLTANTEITTFEDESSQQIETMDMVPTKLLSSIDNPVSEWFKRPTRILDVDWDEFVTLNTQLRPHELFLTNRRIWEKLRGFSRIRGDLHLKFVMNASPFHYGAVLISWLPLGGTKSSDCVGGANPDLILGDVYGNVMLESVRPHVMMFPQDNSSAEMVLKFIYPKPWLTLGMTPETSVELDLLGVMTIRSLTPLMVAQAATGNRCTISVFAWMEDPQLAAPSFIAQSKVMNKMADMTQDLTDMPVLGEAFDVTSKLARATASVMKLMGYSNPVNTAAVHVVTQNALPHLSSTEISVPTTHLGVSERSGLGMEANGVEADELIIADICCKDALLGVYPWTNAGVVGSELFKAYVTPELYRQVPLQYAVAVSDYYGVYQTPCCFASQLFQYWRGTMVFTVRLIASQFHSGRVRIFYDAAQSVPVPTDEAGVYSQVLDLTAEREVEIRVPWNADLPFLKLRGDAMHAAGTKNIATFTRPDTLTFTGAYSPDTHNGAFSIQVLNTLMGPVTSTVYLMVSARLEDAEFAVPCALGSQGRLASETTQPISPFPMYQAQSKFEATPCRISDFDPKDCIGEQVLSFRELLHRSNAYATITPDRKIAGVVTGTFQENFISFPRVPVSPGLPCKTQNIGNPPTLCVSNGSRATWHSVAVGANTYGYNFLNMSPYMYLRGAFTGEKGSHIYKIVSPTVPNSSTSNPLALTITRNRRLCTNQLGIDTAIATGNSGVDAKCVASRPPTEGGLVVNTSAFDNSISVSVPMYSRFSFIPTNALLGGANLDIQLIGSGTAFDQEEDNLTLSLDYYSSQNGATTRTPLRSYHSVGVDFNLMGFLNPPVLFVGQTWPTPKL